MSDLVKCVKDFKGAIKSKKVGNLKYNGEKIKFLTKAQPYLPPHFSKTHICEGSKCVICKFIASQNYGPTKATANFGHDGFTGYLPYEILTQIVTNPVTKDKSSLQGTIIELNDHYHWTREQIADWLDEISDPTGQDGPNIVLERSKNDHRTISLTDTT